MTPRVASEQLPDKTSGRTFIESLGVLKGKIWFADDSELSQARAEGYVIVTSDRAFGRYDVDVIAA